MNRMRQPARRRYQRSPLTSAGRAEPPLHVARGARPDLTNDPTFIRQAQRLGIIPTPELRVTREPGR